MKRFFLFVSTALLVLTSCNQQDLGLQISGKAVDFQANIGSYSVRATDTGFENGDQLAIYAKAPISSGVRKYVYSNGSLTSDNPIIWNEGQTQSTEFWLYYPYKTDMTADMNGYEFTVNADQTTHQLYTQSDLMIASTSAAPGNVVRFNANHALSKVHIYINNLSDKTIKDVYFSGVYGKCTISGQQTAPSGTRGTIKACPVSGADSTLSWIMILPAQTSQPELIVTTYSGEQITYTLPSSFDFKAGYQANARVTLSNNNVFTDFTATINDWLPDNDLQFTNGGQQDQGNWQYLGVGKLMDDIISSIYGIPHYEMDVDVYEDLDAPGRYKFQNPYKDWPHLINYKDDFTYTDNAWIILNTTKGYAYIEKGSTTGISNSDIPLNLESECPENGYTTSYGYGYNDYDGCWQFFDELYLTDYNSAGLAVNYGKTIFTLPGYTRFPVFWQIGEIDYDYDRNAFFTSSSIDGTTFGISILEGYNVTDADIEATMRGTHDDQFLYTDQNNTDKSYGYYFPQLGTGVYTILAAGDGTYKDGLCYYGYKYLPVGYVAPGDSAPVCKPVISSASVSVGNPLAIDLSIKLDAAETVKYAVMDYVQFQALDKDSYLSYARTYGTVVNGTPQSFVSGKNAQIINLQPNTSYVILVYAKNLFGQEGYTIGYANTGGDYEFVSIGQGTFIDNIICYFIDTLYVEYRSTVEILQEKTGKPVYRVLNPYKEWWEDHYWASYYYNGLEPDYIEFYAKEFSSGTYVFFKDFHNGFSIYDFSDEGSPLTYHHGSGDIYENPGDYYYSRYNKQISDGVFELAPMVNIDGTPYMYPYYYDEKNIIICLPGHTYNGNAQTRAPLRSAAGPLKPELIK